MGFWFVLTVYENGRVTYSRRRFQDKDIAEQHADKLKEKRREVKRASVCYQPAGAAIDVKKFI